MGSKALEMMVRSFLVGVSVGTFITMVMKPRKIAVPVRPAQDIVDRASQDSFPAIDFPGYQTAKHLREFKI